MGVLDTFSKRQKKLKGEVIDVFTYDALPRALRVQISTIWSDCFGVPHVQYVGENPAYIRLHKDLANEFGMFEFPTYVHDHAMALINFFVDHASVEQALDMIDYSFRYGVLRGVHSRSRDFRAETAIEDGIKELNQRFLEHGVGYAFIDGDSPQLIKKDNEHLHNEVVMPALRLLHQEGFSGANAEYRKAHADYREGDYKGCLNECLKAFESTMKTICAKKKWAFKATDTASTLIDVCLKNGLLPTFMQTHLGTVKSALESAIPTLRNKLSGHGQGVEPQAVPQYYAEYLLHETAATILFLVAAYREIS